MSASERVLVYLLRFGGLLTGSAFFTLFIPPETMARIHADLGLGLFPAAPMTDYLARSVSAMYAFHGGMLLILSADVRRYLPALRLLGWLTAGLGLVLLGIDLHAPMPAWWTALEGPWVCGVGLLIVWLCGRMRAEVAGRPEAGG